VGFWKIKYRDDIWGDLYRYRFPVAAWIVSEIRYRLYRIKLAIIRNT
jgi:hypothetical protein